MNADTLRKNEDQFLALTSLLPLEFDKLLAEFTPRWERFYRYRTLAGRYRAIPSDKEHGNATLKGNSQKLLFLLTYLKTNSLQQQQAVSFRVSQSKVSRMASVLLEVLNQTLSELNLLPVRNGEELAVRLCNHPQKVFSYDGIERGILRNSCYDAQEEEYSAKKKRIG